MRSRPSRWVASATAAVAFAWASVVHATDPATAQALFDQGRKLMAQERWAEACPKLEESQRLDPAGGTLLHLALCREHEGKIATAWALYQDALAQAKRDSRKDRAKVAQDRIDILGPRLPRMRVRVAAGNRRADGFTVSRNEAAVGEAQWGEPLPVDPGPHVMSAKARGRKTWSARVDVPARPQEVVVEVPELELEPHADPSKPVEPAVASPARVEDPKQGESQRTVAYLVGGVGIVGVVVGSVFGLVSISRGKDADNECAPPDFKICTAKGVEAGSSAMSAGNVSTVAFIAGGALLAGGVILYFTAPSGSSVAIAPSVTHHGASLGLSTSF